VGRSGTDFTKVAFSLLNAQRLDLIDAFKHLPLQPHKLCARLAEASIVVGHIFERIDLIGGWSHGSRLLLSAIGEDGAGVEWSFNTVTVWFSAAPLEGVEGTGQEGLSCLEVAEELLDLGVRVVELRA
jgi:hypothetical protein